MSFWMRRRGTKRSRKHLRLLSQHSRLIHFPPWRLIRHCTDGGANHQPYSHTLRIYKPESLYLYTGIDVRLLAHRAALVEHVTMTSILPLPPTSREVIQWSYSYCSPRNAFCIKQIQIRRPSPRERCCWLAGKLRSLSERKLLSV